MSHRKRLLNKSGLRPLGHAVLVQPYEQKVKGQLIEIPRTAQERMVLADQRATVIAVGPEAWKNERVPRAKPGDKVMISAYAGHMVEGTADGKQYRVVNANDVFLQIDLEPQNGVQA